MSKKKSRTRTDNPVARGEPELVPLLGCGNTCTYCIAVTLIKALGPGSGDSQTRALTRIWGKIRTYSSCQARGKTQCPIVALLMGRGNAR
jgi:hypothetical protein